MTQDKFFCKLRKMYHKKKFPVTFEHKVYTLNYTIYHHKDDSVLHEATLQLHYNRNLKKILKKIKRDRKLVIASSNNEKD